MLIILAWPDASGAFYEVPELVHLVGVVAFLSYFFGFLPAATTGLMACALMRYTHSLVAFVSLCAMASTATCYAVAWIERGAFVIGGSSTTLPAVAVIPAVITGSLWWGLQRRARNARRL